ncbi:MAG: diaminobutyrate acetyltransferase [bacterium]|nr:diaminobutyrate acetyltransferase [bacterium]
MSIYQFRNPRLSDGLAVYQLIQASPPLDLNSAYAYHLICHDFAQSSLIAEREGTLVGFISGYRRPQAPQTLFIWQVAVAPSQRGQGLASQMLDQLIDQPQHQDLRALETTIGPSNNASNQLFTSLAMRRGAQVSKSQFLGLEDFGTDSHEEEILYHISPIHQLP